MYDVDILGFPSYILLGLPHRLSFPLHSLRGKAIAKALCMAKQAISTLWGKLMPPEHLNWLHCLWDLLGMERIAATLNNSINRFDKILGPGIRFLFGEFL